MKPSYLQTPLKRAIFLSGLKMKFTTQGHAICSFKPTKFKVYDFVFREIQARKRAKHQETYSGPHMILKAVGESTYIINLDKKHKGEMKVHYNHLKPFIIPDTTSWTLNMKYLVPALKSLGLQIFQGINGHINFRDLSLLTLRLLNGNPKKIFVIPEWYCAPWFPPLRGILKEKTISVKLPDAPDLFIDSFGNNLGVFAWQHWLIATRRT